MRKPGSEVTEEELVAWSKENMAGYKVPVGVAFVETLPLNASGKLLKTQLRQTYSA